MAQAEYLALQQAVSVLLHLLPDDKKKLAYAIIESIKNQNYESILLNMDPCITEKTAKEFAETMESTYCKILESAQSFDDQRRLNDGQ